MPSSKQEAQLALNEVLLQLTTDAKKILELAPAQNNLKKNTQGLIDFNHKLQKALTQNVFLGHPAQKEMLVRLATTLDSIIQSANNLNKAQSLVKDIENSITPRRPGS